MNHREISEAQANEVAKILEEECGHHYAEGRDRDYFMRSITDRDDVCHEFRFCGALGFGGKFRNNGNQENTPYVDYYSEHKTPKREAMVKRANERLAQLFNQL